LLDLASNLGLSGAVGAGMRYAYQSGFDVAVQFDSDGQHRPEFLPALVKQLAEGADIACGSRFLTEKKPKSLRMLGSNLIASAIRATTGTRLTDPTSGFRAYAASVIEIFSTQIDISPEPDTLSYLIKQGAKVSEVPVVMNERFAGTSYLNITASIRYMLRMFISILLLQPFRGKLPTLLLTDNTVRATKEE
jgi:glycosyltransferase involved in cell wall biosynthesis